MIIGNIEDLTQIELLKKINQDYVDAFDFLLSEKFCDLEKGKVDLGYENVFAIYQEYATHVMEGFIWEGHRKYLDLQFVIEGKEKIGVSSIDNLDVTQSYTDDNDVVLGNIKEGIREVELNKGDFIILFPEEIHLPGIICDEVTNNKKLVVKIPV